MTLLVSALMAVSHLYLGWRLVRAAGFLSPSKKAWRAPVILLASFYLLPVTGLILFGVKGQLDLLELPKYITYWFWFGFVFSIQLTNGVIVMDLLKLVVGWKKLLEEKTLNRLYGRLIVLMTVAVFIYSGGKMVLDTITIETREITVTERNWNPGSTAGPFRVVHISDLQGDQYTGPEDIARYITKVNSLNPDLIIFTGDLISYGTDYIERSARELGKAKAKFGTYAVVGDHDYWAGLSHIEPALNAEGITLLRNENTVVDAGANNILLTGITQVYSQQAKPSVVRQLASDSVHAPLKILASHQVSKLLLREAQHGNYDLFLAGHTHGGQLRVPFFGRLFSASDLETKFVSGPYRLDDLLLNINNGLGFTLAPVRYNARPDITLIEIKKLDD